MKRDFYKVRLKNIGDLGKAISGIGIEFMSGISFPGEVERVLFKAGNNMRNYVIKQMRNTKRASYSYFANGGQHFPSRPYAFPAIDTGQAVGAIAFDTRIRTNKIQLEFGGTDRATYLKFLEMGIGVKPRPWLKPTIKKFGNGIYKDVKEISQDTIINYIKMGLSK